MQSVQANTRQMNGAVVSFFEMWKVHIRKEEQGRRASHGEEQVWKSSKVIQRRIRGVIQRRIALLMLY